MKIFNGDNRMTEVIIVGNPLECSQIMSGEKTLLIRKAKPKTDAPFMCHLYCTGVKRMTLNDYVKIHHNTGGEIDNWHDKVICSFVCDNMYNIENQGVGFMANNDKALTNRLAAESCLDVDDMNKYLKGKTEGFGWHISELKIYNNPKEISEFKTLPCEKGEKACENCKHIVDNNTPNGHERECYVDDGQRITKPPQSWCYCKPTEKDNA